MRAVTPRCGASTLYLWGHTPDMKKLIEHSVQVTCEPRVIFEIYKDVNRWNTWDPDTWEAILDGPLQVGAQGQLTPTQGRTVPMRVTQVDTNRSFTVESRIPLFHMVFEHLLVPHGSQTQVIHRVTLSGPLTFIIGGLLARRIHAGLPVTLRNLKALAERRRVAA